LEDGAATIFLLIEADLVDMKVPLKPPSLQELLSGVSSESSEKNLGDIISSHLDRKPEGRYVHWDELRHLPPPEDFTHRHWWLAIKLARRATYRLPFASSQGTGFAYSIPDNLFKLLHEIDRDASGRIEVAELVTSSQTRDRYLVSSLIEESITSSQLEGAATTYKVAKEMLRQGRKPRNHGEQMIYNNYAAMQFIRAKMSEPVTPQLILQLQSIMTDATLDDESAAGRWRRSDEDVRVVDERNHEVLYVPPPAAAIVARVNELCTFANADNEVPFIHPVVKAIVIHFMMGWIHPFVDGNGRTARALFYWSMAKSGYWLIEFTSISRVLKKAPAQYARAYLHTETDDNDLTYFVDHQLNVISEAIKALRGYLAEKSREIADTRKLIASSPRLKGKLNHRQLSTMDHFLKHSHVIFRIREHQNANQVTYETARTDLLEMVELGLLEKQKEGKSFVFHMPQKLREKLAARSSASVTGRLES
jgi:Fic family protein